ncbi:hypothetical protein [Actinoplanes utahensis]|uniref:Uncharacterized protein n=1 Tax=Actinoplanes utahensis TaxID=1869 RepID=A0A0A6USZ9_ACTUT|nr:hypothetical protein [Actinoplanes utahensis]KHD78556.1 hypothetical protein MB27_04970 [Actinoplanes utahensis]GIF31763.1 hypothetical protein Aut01nite_47490 [Actinoplanes utahensis]
MTDIGHLDDLDDADIDLAIDEGEAGERRATELATRLRMVAAQDPDLAQDLVESLIVALDKAMGGTIRDHLDGPALGVADRVLQVPEQGR